MGTPCVVTYKYNAETTFLIRVLLMYLCGIIIGIFFHNLYRYYPCHLKTKKILCKKNICIMPLPKLGQLVKNLWSCVTDIFRFFLQCLEGEEDEGGFRV